MAVTAIASTAYASLSPISLGFPVWAQNTQSTVFNQANVTAFDLGSANVNFPFMSESGITGQAATTTDFEQNTAFSSFSYPAAGIGVSGISGFWF